MILTRPVGPGKADMSFESGATRRTFLKSTVAAGGVLAVMDQLTGGITRAQAVVRTPAHDEQYLVDGVTAIQDNGVEVIVPPLYKYIITGRLRRDRPWDPASLKRAQVKLEKFFVTAETGKPRTAAGLTLVVAWGLPYFRNFVKPRMSASAWASIWPRLADGTDDAVSDAVRFDSDPAGLIVEDNEIMVMIRSDSPGLLDNVKGGLYSAVADIITITSVRTGFVGRGFDKPSVAKQLIAKFDPALAAKIPANAQLSMGYTSTQRAALPPGNIPSFETLGTTTVRPGDYFSGGSAMHLSHMYIDLPTWYAKPESERAGRMFSPRTTVAPGTVTVPNGPANVSSRTDVENDASTGYGGHNSLLQQATRLTADTRDAYGVTRPMGTAVPAREDFNTLDAPFTSSANPTRDGWSAGQNRPGLHFVVFVPASASFNAARRAMDGKLADGTVLGTPRENGINDLLTTTHRQNFLVPPRTHRSFPMAELLT
jgi:hypothetical protein